MSQTIQELLAEREDAKRQRTLIIDDNLRVNREIDQINLSKKNGESFRKRADLLEQKRLNSEALNAIDQRLATLKQLIIQETPVPFSALFYKHAKLILSPEVFTEIRNRANEELGKLAASS